MIRLICGIFLKRTNELMYKTERVTDVENSLEVVRGRWGWGGMDWEFGLADTNDYIQNRQTRSHCIAQGTMFSILK